MSLKYERLILISLFIVFFAIGLIFSTNFQPVWLDEVAYTEPASNLYFYGKFNSSSWFQSDSAFHTSVSFLYEVLLALWMKIIGFSFLKIRLFNYLLMIISSIFLWLSVKRLKLIVSPFLRITLIASFLTIEGISFTYMSGRYDAVCILLSLLLFFAFSIKNIKKRFITIAILGFLFPLSSLSFVVYSILLLSIFLIFYHSLIWREFILILGSIFCGILFLYFLYSSHGVWNDFVSISVGNSSAAHAFGQNSLIDVAIEKAKKLFDNTDYLCGGCLNSAWPALSILTLIIFFYELLVTRSFRLRSSSVLGLTVALTIPFFMCLIGKYPIYYSWMSLLPMLVCIFHSIDQLNQCKSFYGFKKLIIYSIFGFFIWKASYSGLPLSILVTSQQWDIRNYEPVENFIDKNIKANDVVYADYQTFYAIKDKVKKVYFPIYFSWLKDDDLNKMSVIIIDPREESRAPWNPGLSEIVKNRLQQWYDSGATLDTTTYQLKIYRKKTH